MNQVDISPHERTVSMHPCKRTVQAETFHVESDYYFLQPSQVVDEPKERTYDNT